MLRALAASLAILASAAAGAQQAAPANGLFLVAKPGLLDPNFSRTVVLVTQTKDYRTIGVILNRPIDTPLAIPGVPAPNYHDRLYFGGPVSRDTIVAVLRSAEAPRAPAFRVLRNIWLTLHKENVSALLEDPAAKYRLYAGFSGWAPRQLESEFQREGWYFLPADEASIFREDMSSLWEELLSRATGPKAFLSRGLHAAVK